MKFMILFGLGMLLLTAPARACTAFCMDGPDGPVYACNFDMMVPADGLVVVNKRGLAKQSYRPGTTGKTAKWTSKCGSVSFSMAGREYAWSGMNEAGLCLTTLELKGSEYPGADERPPFDVGAWAQYLLDTCGTVEEAIEANKHTRLVDDGDSPCHLFVIDGTGQGAAFEWHDGEFVCYTGDDFPVRAMTNIAYDRAVESLERGGPKWWWSNPGGSAERFMTAANRMTAFDPETQTAAPDYAIETLAGPCLASNTKWSVVFDVANKKVWWGTSRNPKLKYFTFDAFDFSCDTPTMILDVHAPLEGNVDQAFKPYDRQVNLRTFRLCLDRLGIQVSQADAESLMSSYESFTCASEDEATEE
ncbi:linear amide C-N hydrolase [bacterium]|nr:linear amide C-N hydrolase [bacterium]